MVDTTASAAEWSAYLLIKRTRIRSPERLFFNKTIWNISGAVFSKRYEA